MGKKTRLLLIFLLFTCIKIESRGYASEAIIQSAKLFLEIKDSKSPGKNIFINGKKIGELPLTSDEKFHKAVIEISPDSLPSIATVNILNIENINRADQPKDLFSVKNIYIEVTDDKGSSEKTNIEDTIFNSYKTGAIKNKTGKTEYIYSGCPVPPLRLFLPTDRLGYIKQAFFEEKTGEWYRDNRRKKWYGLDKIAITNSSRTMCDIRPHEFIVLPQEYILDMLSRYNSNTLLIGGATGKKLDDQKSKIQYLRQHGIRISLMYSKLDACSRLPGAEKYEEFFRRLAEYAPLVDSVGMDEWFLSPAILNTEGGAATEITEAFIDAFAEYAGYSDEDAKWAFRNHTSDDPRTLKAWEFCAKIQNDFAREFVRVSKKANPQIKTWISYITKNWNKHVTCTDGAINDFDELLQCQTYWYGRASSDPLNSPLITAPLGIGKILKAEYPNKFLWCGIDPFYTGGKGNRDVNSWTRKHYSNTTEEIVPYLALLYATSEGVFIQNWEGRQLLGYKAVDEKNEYLERLGIDGSFIEDFADTVSLVSKVVPFIKEYKQSDIAYYYDPDADFEIVRRVDKYIASRETNETALGLIEEFCDVNVTKDIVNYQNVIYAGQLFPSKFDYEKQNIYLMYAPAHDEKGNKIPEGKLLQTLGIKGFEKIGLNFFAGNEENGNMDEIRIRGLPKETLATGMVIKNALYPVREASSSNNLNPFLIGARNKNGNILLNSLWPSFVRQDAARTIIRKDMDYFGWTRRDCPQVNGRDKMVAVAFREPRAAVIDFGKDASFVNIKVIMFNGREGLIRNEILKYECGMKIEIPPLNVLIAEGTR